MADFDILVHTTVRIECSLEDGELSVGTGFFFSFIDVAAQWACKVIITNRHVVLGAHEATLTFSTEDEGRRLAPRSHFPWTISNFAEKWLAHPDPTVDLVAIRIDAEFKKIRKNGVNPHIVVVPEENVLTEREMAALSVLEDVVMVGYPNGLWDTANNMPLIRQGAFATMPKIEFEGLPQFVIDCACFPGSSGSPVFHFRRAGLLTGRRGAGTIKLIGVLYAGPQHTAEGNIEVVEVSTSTRAVAMTRIPNNLGYCIKAQQIFALKELLKASSVN